MDTFSTLPSLESVITRHGLSTKKSLGQHFLLDPGITNRIVRYAGDVKNHNVIEIGPGPGGLTRSLLMAGAKKLYVIEKDDRCLAIMAELEKIAGAQLHIIHGDALEVDVVNQVPAPRKIVANLPYNSGTQMLINWMDIIYRSNPHPNPLPKRERGYGDDLTSPSPFQGEGRGEGSFTSLTLMFQKEVAERIIAEHGNKDYGRLSVLCQWLCEVRYDMELPPEAFSPPPKVSSAVITLTPRAKPLVDVKKETLEKVMSAAFGQRRKMLRVALKTLGCDTEKLLAAAGIDGTMRAEQLDVMTLCGLAKTYGQRLG